MKQSVASLFVLILCINQADAGFITYGDKDVLGTGTYPIDPTTGASLEGLAPDMVTFGAPPVRHSYPFGPSPGDFPGTDQINVGSHQTGYHDGYSVAPQRMAGPQILTLDYGSLVGPNERVTTLTLGIAADDFQYLDNLQPYITKINGIDSPHLTSVLESLALGGPQVEFFSIGVSTSYLATNNVLTVSIDEGGDAGEGWAVDFLTVGVTTQVSPVPEPSRDSVVPHRLRRPDGVRMATTEARSSVWFDARLVAILE